MTQQKFFTISSDKSLGVTYFLQAIRQITILKIVVREQADSLQKSFRKVEGIG